MFVDDVRVENPRRIDVYVIDRSGFVEVAFTDGERVKLFAGGWDGLFDGAVDLRPVVRPSSFWPRSVVEGKFLRTQVVKRNFQKLIVKKIDDEKMVLFADIPYAETESNYIEEAIYDPAAVVRHVLAYDDWTQAIMWLNTHTFPFEVEIDGVSE